MCELSGNLQNEVWVHLALSVKANGNCCVEGSVSKMLKIRTFVKYIKGKLTASV